MMGDKTVSGACDSSLGKKRLQVPQLTLEKWIDMCRSPEATSIQLEAMSNQSYQAPEVNFLMKTFKLRTNPPF